MGQVDFSVQKVDKRGLVQGESIERELEKEADLVKAVNQGLLCGHWDQGLMRSP